VPGFDDAALVSVISDEEHERRDGALRRLLGLEDTPRLTA
jgi:hypothetical protein